MTVLKDKHGNELDHADQPMAYYAGDLEGADLVAFEQHLATCTECQALLQKAKEVLPAAEQLAAIQPRHTLEEQGDYFASLVAAKQTGRASDRQPARPLRRQAFWALALAVGAAAALFFWARSRGMSAPHAAPDRPGVLEQLLDGG